MKRNSTFRVIITMLICALLVSLLGACGDSSSMISSDGNAGNSGSSGKGETYSLTFSIHDPAASAKVAYYQTLCDQVSEKTGGAVNITIFPGGTLIDSSDVAEGILSGTADIGWVFTTFFPGQFPLTDIATLPMTYEDSLQADNVLLDLYEQSEALQTELSNYKVLGMSTNPMNYIYSNTPIREAEDVKGLSIRATSGVATDMVKGWGGTPILMGPGDLYEALEKKVLNGFILEWSGVNSYNLFEVVDYCTEFPIFCGVFLVVMNLDSWNRLPEEYQEVMDEVWNRESSIELTEVFLTDAEEGRKTGVDSGVKIITPTDDELNGFAEAANDYVEDYIKENDAQDYYDLAMEIKSTYQ